MKKPSVKKSRKIAARRPKGLKSAVPVVSAADTAGWVGTGRTTVAFEARATTAAGTVAVGAAETFAKERW